MAHILQNQQDTFKHAVCYGYIKLIKRMLTDNLVDPSFDNNTCIAVSVRNSHDDVTELLMNDPRVDPSDNNSYAASQAAKLSSLKLLLRDERVDISNQNTQFWTDNYHLFSDACCCGVTEMVEYLLYDQQIDPTVGNNRGVKNAISNRHNNIVKMLLSDKRIDPTKDVNIFVTACGNKEIFKLLLQNSSFDLSLCSDFVLREFMIHGCDEVLKLLWVAQRFNLPCHKSNIMINRAIDTGRVEIVKMMLTDQRFRDYIPEVYQILRVRRPYPKMFSLLLQYKRFISLKLLDEIANEYRFIPTYEIVHALSTISVEELQPFDSLEEYKNLVGYDAVILNMTRTEVLKETVLEYRTDQIKGLDMINKHLLYNDLTGAVCRFLTGVTLHEYRKGIKPLR